MPWRRCRNYPREAKQCQELLRAAFCFPRTLFLRSDILRVMNREWSYELVLASNLSISCEIIFSVVVLKGPDPISSQPRPGPRESNLPHHFAQLSLHPTFLHSHLPSSFHSLQEPSKTSLAKSTIVFERYQYRRLSNTRKHVVFTHTL